MWFVCVYTHSRLFECERKKRWLERTYFETKQVLNSTAESSNQNFYTILVYQMTRASSIKHHPNFSWPIRRPDYFHGSQMPYPSRYNGHEVDPPISSSSNPANRSGQNAASIPPYYQWPRRWQQRPRPKNHALQRREDKNAADLGGRTRTAKTREDWWGPDARVRSRRRRIEWNGGSRGTGGGR